MSIRYGTTAYGSTDMRQAAPTEGQTAPKRYGGREQSKPASRAGSIGHLPPWRRAEGKKMARNRPGQGTPRRFGRGWRKGARDRAGHRREQQARSWECELRPRARLLCFVQGGATLGSAHRFRDRRATNSEFEDAKRTLTGLSARSRVVRHGRRSGGKARTPDQGAPMMRRTRESPRRIQPARPATSDHGLAAFSCAAC